MSPSTTRRKLLAEGGRAALGLALLPFARGSAAADGKTEPKRRSGWKPLIAGIEEQIPPLMAEQKVPGLSIAVLRDAKLLWRRGFGVSDDVSAAPVDHDTVFEAASVSKTVFAYVVMKLCETGVLGLDSPLTRYTPERLLEGDPRLDLITARRVLSHTSGLQNWRSDDEPLAIHFTPGERFSYSGEGYSYLQSVVTRLTGHVNPDECATYECGIKVCASDIDAYLKARLLTPFGMASSGYVWNRGFARHAAQPHDENGKQSPKRKPSACDAARYAAAGGLHTTPTDYARFLIEVIRPKRRDAFRLDRASHDEMLRAQVKVTDSISQALGWQVLHTEGGDFISHGGGNPGFAAFVVASAERGTGLVVMTNGDNGWKVIDALLAGDAMASLLGARMRFPLL